jgi:4-hydroxy-4-methyl-2-oxoglutarate aldolase
LADRVAARLCALGVATLHEASGRPPVARDLRLLVGEPFAGPAVTVELPAGDNLGIHLALEAAGPGSVLCAGSAGSGAYGVLGELLLAAARARGVAALVIDDGVRDLELLEAPPSVAARGVSAHGTVKRRVRRSVGAAVSVGGVLVRAGDWVVGDTDGICIVPAGEVDAVLGRATGRESYENGVRDRLVRGELSRSVFGLPSDPPASVDFD